jgi:hypothetical protein
MNKATAYHEWLGIAPKEETPNFYEILGVPLFEPDTTVISNGAARQIAFLQSMIAGQFAELAQEIQKEVAQAKLCLMVEKTRLEYQHSMAHKIAEEASDGGVRSVESTFSVAATELTGFTDASLELFVDETQSRNRELSQQSVWLIGSSPDCDLIIKNQFISRKHCLLFRHGDEYEIEDWGSTNGTVVNDVVLTPRVRTDISQSDIITLGKCTLMPWPPIGN